MTKPPLAPLAAGLAFAAGIAAVVLGTVFRSALSEGWKTAPATGPGGRGGSPAPGTDAGQQPASTTAPAPEAALAGTNASGEPTVDATAPAANAAQPVAAAGHAPADRSNATPEHVPTDLMGAEHPGPADRAIDAFRPDPTAPVPPEMREALRPATGPAPTLSADRGSMNSEPAAGA